LKFLLDTNAVSEPRRPAPDPGYLAWLNARESADLAISAMTFGELKRGVTALSPGQRKTGLETWLAEGVSVFGERILPVDLAVASAWAAVCVRHRRLGRVVGVIDELIAATALTHGLVVITRNVLDFDASGCRCLSPWTA
jgi:predicted nucleic acid-binding protein